MSLILNDVADFITSKIGMSEIDETNYISTENMLPNKSGVSLASSLPNTKTVREYLPNDILISNIRPYFKKIWFADKKGGCSSDIFVLRINKKYDSKFIFYVLSSNDFFNYVMANVKGTKMPRGDKKAIQNYKIPNFSIKTQIKISSFLSIIDNKIKLNEKINSNLEEQILKIFNDWFVKFSLCDEFEESKLGLIPKGWSVDYLGSGKSSSIIGSGIVDFEGYKVYIATADVDNSSIINNKTLITLKNKPSRANMQPIEKSIWFAKMIDSRKLIMVDDYCKNILNNYIFSTGFCGLKCSEEYFYYLWSFLLTNGFDTMKNNFCTGTTMQAVNNKDIKMINFVLPDLKTVNKFNIIAKPIFKKIYLNNLEIQKLTKLRDILLPKLMSGEIDVSKINCDLN
ncbi:MAG: restriction endonuclease subunit S [Methanobrevibacter wolinii]|nr:restriction endonuclease subunit S [Methanobrevibacter wolinii]